MPPTGLSIPPVLKLSKDFLEANSFYKQVPSILSKILNGLGYSPIYYNVFLPKFVTAYVVVQSQMRFTDEASMEPTRQALKNVGIKSSDPDVDSHSFRVDPTSIPIHLAEPHMPSKLIEDAKRLAVDAKKVKLHEEAEPAIRSPGEEPDPGEGEDASSSDLHNLVMVLAKEHDLKAPGFPGRSPTGVAIYANIVISADKVELARKTYEEAGLKWRESGKKETDDLVFRFYTGQWPEKAERPKKELREKSLPRKEEPPAAATSTFTTTRTETNNDPEMATRNTRRGSNPKDLKALVDELIDKHDLKGPGYPGRSPSQVYAGRVISSKKIEKANEVFEEAGLKWKTKAASGKHLIYRFYTGEWPDDDNGTTKGAERAETAGKKKGGKKAASKRRTEVPAPQQRGSRKKKVATDDGPLAMIRKSLDELEANMQGAAPDAGELATKVVKILEDAGYACVPKKDAFATIEVKGRGPVLVPNEVDEEGLRRILISGFNAEA